MEKKLKKVNEKGFNKRCVIGRAAARLFQQKGFLKTSFQDISTAVKLSKGGIYHYFSNKDELLYFILDNYVNLLLGGLEGELKKIPDNSSKIRLIMFRHLKLYNSKAPEAKALLIDSRNLPAKYFKAIAAKEKMYAQILTNILSDCLDKRIPKDELKAISYSLFGMCNSIIYWYNPKGSITLEELSEICYKIFLKGINYYKNNLEKNQTTKNKSTVLQ
jgi:AcrR family transcriptional regulator